MEENKVSQQINDVSKDNLRKLKQLFPSIVKDGRVDFDALKSELGDVEEVGSEKYELMWAGKANAKKISREDVAGKTLKYISTDGNNIESTENLYIEGDNLEVLKLLRQNYYGVVKMIYIDPPYNTGNDFVYNDSFSMSKEEDDIASGVVGEDGEQYAINKSTQNRYHANWLNMMYPRLKISRDLLQDDGVIAISIDEHEINNLRMICDEIFSPENCLGVIANVNNPKGRSDDKYVATAHEYIVIYAKNESFVDWHGFEPTEEKIIKRYNKIDENGKKYREIDLRKTGENDLREDRPNLFYYFYYNEKTGDYYPSREEKCPDGYIKIFPQREDGKEGNWRWGLETAQSNKDSLIPKFMPSRKVWGIMEKDYLEGRSLVKPTSAWTFKDVNSERGSEAFIDLGFDKRLFPKPKPIGTIYRLFDLVLGKNSHEIVLDYFAGSGTTAEALFKYNAERNSHNKFILIQYPEKCAPDTYAYEAGYSNICDISKERIIRAGKRVIEDYPEQELDVGFKVLRSADTNIKWRTLLSSGQLDFSQIESTPDMMDFMPGTNDIDVVYEIMLRQRDVPLSEMIEKLNNIGERTYLYADTYLICLESEISTAMIEKMASIDPVPVKYVFRDSAFKDDIALKDETFRRLKAVIEKNTNQAKQTYTVEFI